MATKNNFSAQPVVQGKNTVPGQGTKQDSVSASTFLPGYFKTDVNLKFLKNSIDTLISKGHPEDINLYIGRKSGTVYNPITDFYLEEPREIRGDYQFDTGVVLNDEDGNITDALNYDDFLDQLKINWPDFKSDQLDSDSYVWAPPINTDMFINFSSYYWLKFDPRPIRLEGTINVATDILGKLSYTTPEQSNGKTLTLVNGMKLFFTNKKSITALNLLIGGSGYTDGVYENIPLTGSTDLVYGSGIKVTATVEQGLVTQVELLDGGSGFNVGDILKVSPSVLPQGTGFSIRVNGVTPDTVTPLEYVSSNDPIIDPTYFIVDGVGESIKLIPSKLLDTRTIFSTMAYLPWDGTNWDQKKWDTSEIAGSLKEYVVMARGATDQNPWSRTNKWYHVDAVKATCEFLDINAADLLPLELRAARPIIQFNKNIELYDYGKIVKQEVNLIIDRTLPSDIAGQSAYMVDAIHLKNEMRVLFINGTHSYNNKTYIVRGVGSAIEFVPASDTVPINDQKVFVTQGNAFLFRELWYTGTKWQVGQNKLLHNQAPKFNLYDNNGKYLGSNNEWTGNDFAGNTLFEYAPGDVMDAELGINISYESTNFQLVDSSSPFAKIFTNIVFNNTQGNRSYYNADGLRTEIPGNYYYQYFNDQFNKPMQSNSWVKSSEPPKTYQRVSRTIVEPQQDNVLSIPIDSRPSYTYMITQEYGNIAFWCLSKNNEWERFDPNTNTLVVPIGETANILNMSDMSFTVYRDDIGYVTFPWIENNGANTGLISITAPNFIKLRYEFNGQIGQILITDTYLDPRSFIIRVNGYDQSGGITWEQNPINRALMDVYVDGANLKSGDYIEALFESSIELGVYAIHSTLEANADQNYIVSAGYNSLFNHFKSKLLSTIGFSGEAFGKNNYFNIHTNPGEGWVVGQPENSSLKLAVLLRNSDTNPINALRWGSIQYKSFRQKFLQKIESLNNEISVTELTPAEMLNIALTAINIGKDVEFPHALSDMAYWGAINNTITYLGATSNNGRTFALPIAIDINDPYRNHVYININNQSLIAGRDFELGNTTITLTTGLTGEQNLTITVYETKNNCYIPPTLAKLGMAPVYTPEIIIDNTYTTPVTHILCHDGSKIVAYGDYRDDIIFELEARIYNNIFNKFKENRFDWDRSRPGYYRNTRFNNAEYLLYAEDLYRLWATNNGVTQFSNDNFYRQENKFTWNFSSCNVGSINRNGTGTLTVENGSKIVNGTTDDLNGNNTAFLTEVSVGNVLKTSAGFDIGTVVSIESDSRLILVDACQYDHVSVTFIVIDQGTRAGGSWRAIYKHLFDTDRPHTHPWEMLGYTVKPSWWDSAYSWTNPNKRTPLITALRLGNISPPSDGVYIDLRYARPAAEFPVNYLGQLLDPVAANIVTEPTQEQAQVAWTQGDMGNQEMAWVHSDSYPWDMAQWKFTVAPNKFVEKSWQPEYTDIDFYRTQYSISNLQGSRPQLSDYVFHRELDDVGNVITRYGLEQLIVEGLVSDSKTVSDSFSTNLRYATVQPIFKVGGFADKRNLTFIVDSFKTQKDTNIVPEENYGIIFYKGTPYTEFFYSGVKITFNGKGYEVSGTNLVNPYFIIYRPKTTTRTRDFTYGNLTIKEAIDWEQNSSKLDYGTTLTSREEVVNFLLGYNKWIIDQGVVFSEYDSNMSGIKDFRQSAQHFLFWSETQWNAGYSINLSPCANKLEFKLDRGFVEDLNYLDRGFSPLLNKDSVPIDVSNVTVNRGDDGLTSITVKDNQIGLFGIRLRIIDIEHAIVFDNETVFNDTIYDPVLRLKQYRLKLIGQRTADWQGRPYAPGYLIYGNSLIANFDRTIDDMDTRYFNVEGNTLNSRLVETARHTLGVNTKNYLGNLLENPTVAFEFQRGMMRQQGTPASYNKLLRNTKVEGDVSYAKELVVDEEWLFKLGDFGANETKSSWNLQLKQREFKDAKQVFRFMPDYDPTTERSNIDRSTDSIIDIMTNDSRWIHRPGLDNLQFPVRKKSVITNDSNEIVYDEDLPTPGFVSFEHVSYSIGLATDLKGLYNSIDPTTSDRPNIWVGNFEFGNWSMLRQQKHFNISSIVKSDANDPTGPTNVTFSGNINTALSVGDWLHISNTNSSDAIDGFYRVDKIVSSNTVEIDSIITEVGTAGDAYSFVPVKFDSQAKLQQSITALSRYTWVDNQLAFIEEAGSPLYGYAIFMWQDELRDYIPYKQFDLIDKEQPLVDTYAIDEVLLYDHALDRVLLDIERWDPYKGIIPTIADVEINIKSPADPAQYEISSDPNVTINSDAYWERSQLGLVWWDVSTAKYVTYEQGTLDYRLKNWGKLFTGSSIDIYEWTESTVDPVAYNEAVSNGTPLDGQVPTGVARVYPTGIVQNTSYSTYTYVIEDGSSITKYYFWVKDKTVVPAGKNVSRKYSTSMLANIIKDPTAMGIPWFSPVSEYGFVIYGVQQFLNDTSTSIQIKFKTDSSDTNLHSQWMVLRELDNNTTIPEWLHIRLRDSMVGYDSTTYIASFDNYEFNYQYAYGDIVKQNNYYYRAFRDFTEEDTARAFGQQPFYKLYEYILLPNNRIKMPLPNDVPDPRINQFNRYGNQIRPSQQTWIKNRSEARRNFIRVANELLATMDVLSNLNWNKHLVDFTKGEYDYQLTKFYDIVDFIDANYDSKKEISYGVTAEADIPQLANIINDFDYILVKNDSIGKYAIYEYIQGATILRFRKSGTIQFKEILFNSQKQQDLWDLGPWDFKRWDPEPSQEFYEILTALREDIFVGSRQYYYNRLFFAMIRFVYSEQDKVDWIQKSTYLHIDNLTVRGLTQEPQFKKDKVDNFIEYIDNSKPYRSKLREVLDTRDLNDETTISPEDSYTMDINLKFDRTGQGPNLVNIIDGTDFNMVEPGFQRRAWDSLAGIDPTREELEQAYLNSMYEGAGFGLRPDQIQAYIDGRAFNLLHDEMNPDEELAIVKAGDNLELLVQTKYGEDQVIMIIGSGVTGQPGGMSSGWVFEENAETTRITAGWTVRVPRGPIGTPGADQYDEFTVTDAMHNNMFNGWGVTIFPVAVDLHWPVTVLSPAPEYYSFRMLKSLNNEWKFTRIVNSGKTTLTSDFNLQDEYIFVENGLALGGVDISFKSPGVIYIDGERIEYYEIIGNRLGKLLRGTLGTGISTHVAGTTVYDADPKQTIPVENERQGNISFSGSKVIFNEPGKTLKESKTLAAKFITQEQGDLN